MTFKEFSKRIRARGYWLPAVHTSSSASARREWLEYLRLTPNGSGHPQDYTDRHVDLVVAWQRVMVLTGHGGRPPKTLRRAARMLATAPEGFVYISKGQVQWSLAPPIQALRHGATCWTVER